MLLSQDLLLLLEAVHSEENQKAAWVNTFFTISKENMNVLSHAKLTVIMQDHGLYQMRGCEGTAVG